MNKDLKEFLRYFSLIISIFFLNKIFEYYIVINWNINYAWLGLVITAFAFYMFSKSN